MCLGIHGRDLKNEAYRERNQPNKTVATPYSVNFTILILSCTLVTRRKVGVA